MTPADPFSCAIKEPGSTQKTSFATTQAIWRFLNNQRVAFKQLNDPLLSLAQTLGDNTGCHSTLADDLLPRETHPDALIVDILKLEKLGIEKNWYTL